MGKTLKNTKKRPLQLSEMSIIDHLSEFRKRIVIFFIFLLIAFSLCFYYVDNILEFIAKPLFNNNTPNKQISLIYTSLQEAFFIKIKVAFWASAMLVLPILFYQIWQFSTPALFKHEKNKFLLVVFASPVLFWLGVIVSYYFVIPQAWKFFTSYALSTKSISIDLLPRVTEYLSLFMQIILAFAIAFQFPVVLFLLVSLGIVELNTIKKARRIIIVIAFIFAAIVTPPDPISQVVLALFLILLFEITLILLKIFNIERSKIKNG